LETEGEGEEDLERTRERVIAEVPVPGGPAEKEKAGERVLKKEAVEIMEVDMEGLFELVENFDWELAGVSEERKLVVATAVLVTVEEWEGDAVTEVTGLREGEAVCV